MKKKTVAIIVALAILVALVIGGVFLFFHLSNDTTDDNYEEITTSIYQKEIDIDSAKDSAVDVDTTPKPVKLSDKSLGKFEEYISNIDVDYDFEDLYLIDENIKKYNYNLPNTVKNHSHDIRNGGEFDGDYFYNIVKDNNKRFLKKAKADDQDWYEEYRNKQLKTICNEMVEALPKIAQMDDSFDLDTVCCYLYNISILKSNRGVNMDFAGFTMDKRFYVNYENLEHGGFALESENPIETTMFHEYMHAFQFACDDMTDGKNYRIGMTQNNLLNFDPNSLAWTWLLEGSAEMNMSQYLGVGYSTYATFTTYIESLNYLASVGSGSHVQLELISNQHDINKIFEFFNVKTEKEKREIIKMMYSIELVQKDIYDFYDVYDEKYGVDMYDDSNGENAYFKLKLKDDYLLTMTKLFYRNLARQINAGDVTLQDVYYLMRIWEADLDRHFSNCTSIAYMEFFHDFYDKYVEIQDEFYSTLAKDNDLDKTAIMDDFENYSINTKDKSPNCDLKFIDKSGKEYISSFSNFYKKGYISIKKCQQKTAEYDKEYPISTLDQHREYLCDN